MEINFVFVTKVVTVFAAALLVAVVYSQANGSFSASRKTSRRTLTSYAVINSICLAATTILAIYSLIVLLTEKSASGPLTWLWLPSYVLATGFGLALYFNLEGLNREGRT